MLRTVFQAGIQDSIEYIQHFVLLVGFLGGMLASRENSHLAIAAANLIRDERARATVRIVSHAVALTFTTAFAVSALEWWITAFGGDTLIGFIPIRVFAAVVPISFGVMAVRFALTAPRTRPAVAAMMTGAVFGLVLAAGSVVNLAYTLLIEILKPIYALDRFWYGLTGAVAVPLIILLLVEAFSGTPLFVVFTGIGYLLFAKNVGILAVVPNEGYAILTSNTIPSIPMFTFVGYNLSESKAGTRFFRLFRTVLI